MKRLPVLLTLCLLTAGLCQASGPARLEISLIWHERKDSKPVWHRHSFGILAVDQLTRHGGLAVAFVEEREQLFAGVCLQGTFQRNPVPSKPLSELRLLLKDADQQDVSWTTTIFSESRAFGTHAPDLDNVYYVAVLAPPSGETAVPPVLPPPGTERWQLPLARTGRLAIDYAEQSEQKTRDFAHLYGVKTTWSGPRIVVASEEWITLKEDQRRPVRRNAGGLFGGALDEVGDAMAGRETELAPKRFPVYSLDVLRDEAEATGQWATGFRTARSIWTNVLEGIVLSSATGPTRRVLTTTGVFCQLAQNRQLGRSRNHTLKVTKQTFAQLYRLPGLNPQTQASITAFLFKHPNSHVIIPAAPVTVYDGDKPLYGVYAYWQADPVSGRMVGKLTNTGHGAVSDELARLEQGLVERIKDKVGSQGAPVKVFFGQVAGMYVSSAGMLDGIALTIVHPELANMEGDKWQKFLADNCLDFCQQFIEDNAAMYDSYEALIGFWQGAIPLLGEFGGKEAAAKAVDRALAGVRGKAIADVRGHFEAKAKELGNLARKDAKALFDKTMDKYAPNVRKAAEAAAAIRDAHGKVVSAKDAFDDYRQRAEAVWNEMAQGYGG